MEKLYLYIQIHQLKDQGFSKSAIARKLGVCRNTVYTYLGMSLEEATEWIATLDTRRKKLEPYHAFALEGFLLILKLLQLSQPIRTLFPNTTSVGLSVSLKKYSR